MPRVDICGITNTEDAKWAAIHGVEYLDICMSPDSPRKISMAKAEEISELLPSYSQLGIDFGAPENIDIKKIKKLSPDLVKFFSPKEEGELKRILNMLEQEECRPVIKIRQVKEAEEDIISSYFLQLQLGPEFSLDEINQAAQTLKDEKCIFHGEFGIDLIKKACGVMEPHAWCVEESVLSSPRRMDYLKMKKYIREISLL